MNNRYCKPRWGYSWVGVGNPKSSKSNPKSHEVTWLGLIVSFVYKTHKGEETISWFF
jgi:hypothetical protein